MGPDVGLGGTRSLRWQYQRLREGFQKSGDGEGFESLERDLEELPYSVQVGYRGETYRQGSGGLKGG